MHTTLQQCQDALEAAQDQAQGLVRTLAATLAHMYPHAAYLVLRREPRSGELHLDSLRTASGAQGVCGDLDTLLELTDPELRTAGAGPIRATLRPCSRSSATSTVSAPRSAGSPTRHRSMPTRTRTRRPCCASWSTPTRPSPRATTGK